MLLTKSNTTMKTLFVFLLANVIAINTAFSQGAAINSAGTAADASAMLDISSTNQGILIPRLTEFQKNSIVLPATGLMIYQTDAITGFWYFDGTIWVQSIGPQGQAGLTGPQGPTGPAGSTSSGTNPGDMLYWTGTQWSMVPGGNYGQGLYYCNGVPTWGGCFPVLTTTPASLVAGITATSGGDITNDGGFPVTARGICYSTSPNPTIADITVSSGSGIGTFVSNMTGLSPTTTYYVRAFATNAKGTGYGNEITFTTTVQLFQCGTSTIGVAHLSTDTYSPIDVTLTYGTVSYAGKCWTDRNLGASQLPVSIGDATQGTFGWYWRFNRKQGYQNTGGSNNTPTWDGSAINENSNWIQANDPCFFFLGSEWRIPTISDWNAAIAAGANTDANAYTSPLKIHHSGRINNGTIDQRGGTTCCSGDVWSSNQVNNTVATMYYTPNLPGLSDPGKTRGNSLRCVRD